MVPSIVQAIRDLLAGWSAEVTLLDVQLLPHATTRQALPADVTLLISFHGDHVPANLAGALGAITRTPFLALPGDRHVPLRFRPIPIAEKAQLWLALNRPWAPGFVVDAGPVEL
jgi:hypothetical protein